MMLIEKIDPDIWAIWCFWRYLRKVWDYLFIIDLFYDLFVAGQTKPGGRIGEHCPAMFDLLPVLYYSCCSAVMQ